MLEERGGNRGNGGISRTEQRDRDNEETERRAEKRGEGKKEEDVTRTG